MVLMLFKHIRIVVVMTILIGVIGLVIALTAAPYYTTSATVISESEADGQIGAAGGLSLLRGLGLGLSGGASGITPETYPDILMSREVRLAVVRDTFYFPALGKRTTYVEYAMRPTLLKTIKRNTIRVPGRIIAALSAAPVTGTPSTAPSVFPTRQEEIAMRLLAKLVEPSINPDTGLLKVTVSGHTPQFTAALTQRLLEHLARRIETLRTQKARQNLAFIENRFEEAAVELREAENKLAAFNDRNTNLQSARLRTEQKRLERQLSFKTELYGDLQAQRMQERIEFERNRPVMTILEHPAPPIDPSGPNRLLIIISGVLFGAMLGITIAFLFVLIDNIKRQEEAHKLEALHAEYQATLNFLNRFRPRFTRRRSRDLTK